MGRRKNRKARKNPISLPESGEKKLKSQNTTSQPSFPVAKTRRVVSIPTCLAGMFLALVLGVYLGTLLPEMLVQKMTSENVAPPSMPAAMEKTSAARPEKAIGTENPLEARIASLKASLAQHPENEADWISLGDLYFDSGLSAQAIDAYAKALAIRPDNPDVLTDMGIMLRENGEYLKALECFHKASQLNPHHVNSLYNEGLVLAYDLKDTAGARAVWEKLLAIKPDARSPSGKPLATMLRELR